MGVYVCCFVFSSVFNVVSCAQVMISCVKGPFSWEEEMKGYDDAVAMLDALAGLTGCIAPSVQAAITDIKKFLMARSADTELAVLKEAHKLLAGDNVVKAQFRKLPLAAAVQARCVCPFIHIASMVQCIGCVADMYCFCRGEH